LFLNFLQLKGGVVGSAFYLSTLLISAIYRKNFKPQIFTDILTSVKQI